MIVAAGSGSRYGRAKQYDVLVDRRVLDWSIATARAVSDGVVLVVSAERRDDPEPGADCVVCGGSTRSESVRAGLAAVPDWADVILVHDAARPLADVALFERVIHAVRAGAAAVVPGTAVVDTIRRSDGGVVDRSNLVAVQTPQGFAPAVLRAAHATGADATDDASLVEAAGGEVVVVEGDPRNRKITTPDDLAVAEALLRAT